MPTDTQAASTAAGTITAATLTTASPEKPKIQGGSPQLTGGAAFISYCHHRDFCALSFGSCSEIQGALTRSHAQLDAGFHVPQIHHLAGAVDVP